jgi:hypothetical protein
MCERTTTPWHCSHTSYIVLHITPTTCKCMPSPYTNANTTTTTTNNNTCVMAWIARSLTRSFYQGTSQMLGCSYLFYFFLYTVGFSSFDMFVLLLVLLLFLDNCDRPPPMLIT